MSVEEAIAVGTGLVNNVHIIKGTVAGEHPTSAPEYTTFSVIKVPSSKSFLFRGYTGADALRGSAFDVCLVDRYAVETN